MKRPALTWTPLAAAALLLLGADAARADDGSYLYQPAFCIDNERRGPAEPYEPQPGDVGMHFLVAPTDRPVHGFTRAVITAVMAHLFANPATARVVVEQAIGVLAERLKSTPREAFERLRRGARTRGRRVHDLAKDVVTSVNSPVPTLPPEFGRSRTDLNVTGRPGPRPAPRPAPPPRPVSS